MVKDQSGDEDDPREQEARRGAWPTWHHVLPGPATCVDQFVPLQVPDAIEDPPADFTGVDVPESRHRLRMAHSLGRRAQRVHLHKRLYQQVW